MPDVCFAITGDPRRNSRALKQVRVLADLGCTIELIGFDDGVTANPYGPDVRLRLLERPSGSGPRFFHAVHRRMREAAADVRADVYHASDLYVLPALARTARRHGGRLAFDARELYPYVASTRARPGVSLFWHLVQHRYLKRVDAVFTVSDSIARWLKDTYGVDPVLLYNAPLLRPIHPTRTLRERLGLDDDRVLFLHQGQMQKDRGGALLVESMREVDGAVLVFLGGGPLRPALQKLARSLELQDRVYFLDPVPPDELLDLTATADVGVTFLEDTCLNHRYALPNKLFEYLAAGLPVLGSDLPEVRSVIVGYDVGCVADPNRPPALVDAFRTMASDPTRRAVWSRNAPTVFETFGWSAASQRLRTVYRRLLSP